MHTLVDLRGNLPVSVYLTPAKVQASLLMNILNLQDNEQPNGIQKK